MQAAEVEETYETEPEARPSFSFDLKRMFTQ